MIRWKRERRNNDRGFTLMEVMIVIAILASMAFLIIVQGGVLEMRPRLGEGARKLSSLIVRLRDASRLRHVYYRLVINLDPPQGMWVEGGEKGLLRRLDREEEEWGGRFEKKEEEGSDGYKKDFSILKAPIQPKGWYILDIEYPHLREALKSGKGYIQMFPTGQVTKAIIHLAEGDIREVNPDAVVSNENVVSLLIDPLTGRSSVVNGYARIHGEAKQ